MRSVRPSARSSAPRFKAAGVRWSWPLLCPPSPPVATFASPRPPDRWHHFTRRLRGSPRVERQLTTAPHGHILTNTNVWSADGKWIAYDVRSDVEGSAFDGDRIERV